MTRDLDGPLVLDLSFELDKQASDLTVSITSDSTGSALFDMVASESGVRPNELYVLRNGRAIESTTRLIDVGLLRGDLLSSSPGELSGAESDMIELRVLSGAEPAILRIPSGSFLGRSNFRDETVSGEHCAFVAGPSGTSVKDLGSTNGTYINGRRIDRPTELRKGDRIELGSVVVEFLKGSNSPRSLKGGHLTHESGYLAFTRPARRKLAQPQTVFEFPDPPSDPPKARFPKEAAIVPILFGGVMVAVTGSWFFAVFMLMGPLMFGASYLEDKRSGRANFEEKTAEYRSKMSEMRLTVSDSHQQLVAFRRAQTPRLSALEQWARAGSADLWTRKPTDDDFLQIALGDADTPTEIEFRQREVGSAGLASIGAQIAKEHAVDKSVPISLDLRGSIAGLVNDRSGIAVDAARSIVAQTVALRSPRDLRVAVIAPEAAAEWEWAKWLPHTYTNQVGSPAMLGLDHQGAGEVFGLLQDLLGQRQELHGDRIGGGSESVLPHMLVVIQPPAKLRAGEVRSFIEDCERYGFSVLYIASTREELPGNQSVRVEPSPQEQGSVDIEFADGRRYNDTTPRILDSQSARELARNLAPLVDVTAVSASGEVPSSSALPQLVGHERVSEESILSSWFADEKGLAGVIGATAEEPFELDLVDKGPHGLVAGTTGSGKTEFLQAMVMGLAIRHSPQKLNFIFIDYKANQVFQDLARLPHTVGLVTNLDRRLVDRSLVSLEAELVRRQQLFLEHKVENIGALRREKPQVAPPYLYLIVDEFARLKSDAEEFLDGLVEVAVAGRSLGIHLILATQDPTGIVPGQINSNINVRCALRVATREASNEVIGTPAASEIPEELPGRAFIKVGATRRSIAEVQANFMGAHSLGGAVTHLDDAQAFSFDTDWSTLNNVQQERGTAGTDGAMLIQRTRSAWSQLGSPALHLPWTEPLPTLLPLGELLPRATAPRSPVCVPIGLADVPEQQQQVVWSLDLERAGNAVIYGTAGSGKSTLLRSIAASLCAFSGPQSVTVFGLDFGAGGLEPLRALPGVADVMSGRRPDLIEAAMVQMRHEVDQRLAFMGEHAAGSWAELRTRIGDECPPYWVVLIDGLAALWSQLESLGTGDSVADGFVRLLAEARTAGIHFVLSADQSTAVPHVLRGAIGQQIVQRMASSEEYERFDIDRVPSADYMPPGRAIVIGGPDVQCGVLVKGAEHTAAAQAAALADLGGRLTKRGDESAPSPFAPLPELVPTSALAHADSVAGVPLGLALNHEPLVVDLQTEPALLIVGRAGSGRSTTLGAIARQLRPLVAQLDLIAGKSSSPLVGATHFDRSVGRDAGEYLENFQTLVRERAAGQPSDRIGLLIDDAEVLFDSSREGDCLESILYDARDAGVIVAVSAPTFQTYRSYDPWIKALQSAGHAIALQPDPDSEGELFDVPFPRNTAAVFPPGRGYYLKRGTITTAHFLSDWR